MVSYITAGESHGKALVGIIEGIPPGVEISTDDIIEELKLRRSGVGRGERQKFEQDKVTILSGVIHGKTIASPIAIEIENSEWAKWDQIMSPDFVENINQQQPNMPKGEENDKLVRPRPGHADLEGMLKYGFKSSREVLERSSARETAARVACGTVAQKYLEQAANIRFETAVLQFGEIRRYDYNSEVEFTKACQEYLEVIKIQQDTIGGVVEVVVKNVPRGLGSYISAKTRIDSAIASAVMSVQAVKGVEIGEGFNYANLTGSNAHDEIVLDDNGRYKRVTNHAGGIEGGMTNGEELVVKAVIKPIPSVPKGMKTVDLTSNEPALSHAQRSDASAVFPAQYVLKAEIAMVLADFMTQKYGADSLI